MGWSGYPEGPGQSRAGLRPAAALRAGIEHQGAGLRIDPDPHAALIGEDHGQQVQLGLVLEVALLLLSRLAAFGLFEVLGLIVDLAIEYAGGQHLGLCHDAHHPPA